MESLDPRIVIGILVAVAVVVIAFVLMQKRRSDELRGQFGPEYERLVRERGDPRHAESELSTRVERVKQLHIKPLSPEQRDRFADAWRSDQARFVDDPKGAVMEADRLVADLMQVRGYPVGDFEQRAADVSVDHPHVVQNYRVAHDIAVREQRGEASTEDLRKAMVHYRALFEDLLESDQHESREVHR
ncbi:MAG TPA: hypothetical protein VFZ21_01560 [Gemmatimonadaceae bacterium]|jgi:hypothetical protein|nr:hypothetical protein [Gemmatimonadaceae bacterium]